MSRRPVLLALVVAFAGCAPGAQTGLRAPDRALAGTDGGSHAITPTSPGKRLTVLVFSAWHCPCQTIHDQRLRDLALRYAAQGVDFFAVDSEVKGTLATDAEEASARGYAFPVLRDPDATLAHGLRAEYATETFVLDRRGTVRYHGGIDSDRTTLHPDATPHLANALEDLVAGRPVRAPETKALGCALQTW